MRDNVEHWGKVNGEEIFVHTLTEKLVLRYLLWKNNYFDSGPYRFNELGEFVLGFNTLDGYLDSRSYKRATLGRYANRISEGVFNLKGIKYRLTQNKYANHLQDGFEGFNKKIC